MLHNHHKSGCTSIHVHAFKKDEDPSLPPPYRQIIKHTGFSHLVGWKTSLGERKFLILKTLQTYPCDRLRSEIKNRLS